MPIQRIPLSSQARALLDHLIIEGQAELKKEIFEASSSAQELVQKGFTAYEDGALKLIKDCRKLHIP